MMISTTAMMTILSKVKYNSIGNAGHDWTSKLSQKSKAAATSLIGLIRFVAWKDWTKNIFLLQILGTFFAPIDVPFPKYAKNVSKNVPFMISSIPGSRLKSRHDQRKEKMNSNLVLETESEETPPVLSTLILT